MPFKFNACVCGKFAKAKYRVTNWAEYNESLRLRGDVSVWFDVDIQSGWRARGKRKRGGIMVYADLAIEVCLTIRSVFGLALRQTQGFVRSLLKLMKINLPVPDFSTLSRRGKSLKIQPNARPNSGPITLIVDSTGLRRHSGRDWMEKKHGISKPRKTWRKLHIGIDPESGEVVASSLTTEQVGDPTELANLFDQVNQPVSRFIADGAYDGEAIYTMLTTEFGPDVEVIIPPPTNAVVGTIRNRNTHLEAINVNGRIKWQQQTGYNQRSRVEAQIGRYKHVIGPQLRSRKLERQVTETKIAVNALNRMTHIGRATFERVK